jgi:hypothetical protein
MCLSSARRGGRRWLRSDSRLLLVGRIDATPTEIESAVQVCVLDIGGPAKGVDLPTSLTI